MTDDEKRYMPVKPMARGCAHCSCRVLHLVEGSYETGWFVACENCGAQGPMGVSAEEAIDLWDNRLGDAEISNYERLIYQDTTH